MTAEENKRLVRRYYDDVLGRGDLAQLDVLFAPDFVGHSAGFPDFRLEDVRRSLEQERTAFTDAQTTVEEQIAEGDKVVTRWRYEWTHDREFMGAPPTGRRLMLCGVQIHRMVDGRIVEVWEIKDRWSLVQQLGGRVVLPGNSAAEAP
jgi:steroid delta-isomerase-like uncharacterized protein